MQQVFRAIGRLSRSSVNVLITGESGTGKELVARALHEHSPRAGKPFIALNTSAIPAELLESELFGHEKGAFTGADSLRRGRFEQADGGTLFLDEIGDMSLPLQTRLLRVLAEGEFYRVGGQTPIRVDVRVIAATHQNLEERVRARTVPRGPVPSPERHPHRAAAAARAARGHSGSAGALPEAGGAGTGRRAQGPDARAPPRCSRRTLAGQRARAGQSVPALHGAGAGQRDPHRGPAREMPSGGRRRGTRRGLGASCSQAGPRRMLAAGATPLLDEALPRVRAHADPRRAASSTQGHRQEAAQAAGLGPQHADAQAQGTGDGRPRRRTLKPPGPAAWVDFGLERVQEGDQLDFLAARSAPWRSARCRS